MHSSFHSTFMEHFGYSNSGSIMDQWIDSKSIFTLKVPLLIICYHLVDRSFWRNVFFKYSIFFSFPLNPCLKIDFTRFSILFSVKGFKKKEMAFLTERFHQNILRKDDNKWAIVFLSRTRFRIHIYMIHSINIEYAMLFWRKF